MSVKIKTLKIGLDGEIQYIICCFFRWKKKWTINKKFLKNSEDLVDLLGSCWFSCGPRSYVALKFLPNFRLNVLWVLISRGPNLRIRDYFSGTQPHEFLSKVWCIWSHFREGGPLLRPGKRFFEPKTDVIGKTVKAKKWVKNWQFSKVVFDGNDRYNRREREILSKKVYYNKFHTQNHEEIQPFKGRATVSSIMI